jgi:nitronate monooxygenase
LINLFDIALPIIQAPMAGSAFSNMVVAVSEAGGLGSLACALVSVKQARGELESIRRKTSSPINVNFFCHQQPRNDPAREMSWRRRLDAYYTALGLENNATVSSSSRVPFDDKMCDLITEFHPEVVSFHFGLPDKNLLLRVRRAGAKVLSSATTVDEACWLEDQGCDAMVAQGYVAGEHRGVFLTQDVSTQVGTMTLVPQVADAVRVPGIAAGGIADARGIVAAFALGAAAVQIGTACLHCPEKAQISPIYRQALKDAKDNQTAITHVFTGRPPRGVANHLMREVGPMSGVAPEFPLAAAPLAPLRVKSESAGSVDFTRLWSGQAARLSQRLPAAERTKQSARETLVGLRLLYNTASPDVLAQAAALAKVGISVSR